MKEHFSFFLSFLISLFSLHLLLLHINNFHFDQNTKELKFPLGLLKKMYRTFLPQFSIDVLMKRLRSVMGFYLYVNQIGSVCMYFTDFFFDEAVPCYTGITVFSSCDFCFMTP